MKTAADDRSVHGRGLNERDLQLLHALQVAPRLPWAEAARILGGSAATLADRWDHLRSSGLAWVTAHPGGSYRHVTLAFVEVDCVPGYRNEVIQTLCADGRVVTVEETTRGRDLLLTVITANLAGLTHFVFEELESLNGIARQRTYVATAVHRHGSHWRLDALQPQQEEALERADRAHRPSGGTAMPPPEAWPLIQALAADGRRTAADLARLTGRNPATVRRQVSRLLASDLLSFRCELASEVSGWSVSSTWTARVAAAQHERTVTALATLPELRMCVSITGEANLAMTVWTRSVQDLVRIERLFGERLPWLEIQESAVNLRTPKRMGWLLAPDGRTTGRLVVPTALAQV